MAETLEDMFVHNLKQLYHIENKLVDVLEEQAEDANDESLSAGFREHLQQTREHVERLETVFDAIGLEPAEGRSKVLEAIIEERQEFRRETDSPELRDLYDIQTGMKTERVEMTGYQGLITLAKKLNYDDGVTEPLEDNLSSERATFYKLQAFSQGSKLKEMVSQILG